MILESVAACSAALNAINAVVSKVNETGSGVQQLYGMCADFLQALDDFEANKKASTVWGNAQTGADKKVI